MSKNLYPDGEGVVKMRNNLTGRIDPIQQLTGFGNVGEEK